MPDVALLVKAALVGALTAAAVMWLATRLGPRVGWGGACWTWAIGAGVLAASSATDQWPRWPLEDRARFVMVLAPLAIVVETVATTRRSGRAAWLIRLALSAVVAPILLHNSVYLADLNGQNSALWSSFQATIVLCGLATLLTLVWALLRRLQSRTSASAVHWTLTFDALATACHGHAFGLLSMQDFWDWDWPEHSPEPRWPPTIARPPTPPHGSLAMGVIGVFSVVLMGRFFGNLSDGLAACLVVAPLLGWTVELPWLRGLGPGLRGAGRLACVAIPLVVVVIVAQRRFGVAFNAHSGTTQLEGAEIIDSRVPK